jgi:hypothetical protein
MTLEKGHARAGDKQGYLDQLHQTDASNDRDEPSRAVNPRDHHPQSDHGRPTGTAISTRVLDQAHEGTQRDPRAADDRRALGDEPHP